MLCFYFNDLVCLLDTHAPIYELDSHKDAEKDNFNSIVGTIDERLIYIYIYLYICLGWFWLSPVNLAGKFIFDKQTRRSLSLVINEL